MADRRLWLALVLLVVLMAIGLFTFVASTAIVRAAPPVEPPPAPAEPAPRADKVVLRRPAPVATPEPMARNRPIAIEAEQVEVFEPMNLTDLPQEDVDRIAPQALARIADLDEACGHLAEEGGTNVSIHMVVDERGLLEMQLGHYDGETAAHTGIPLPTDFVDCLDDAVWDLDWPMWEGGVQFALTTAFEPD